MKVKTKTKNNLFIVKIDRPEVANAIDRSTATELVQAFNHFEQNEALHVAVLHGSNHTFCAGGDLQAMLSQGAETIQTTADGAGPLGPSRMALSKPVIAAVEGHAVAGGLELACWCDLRVASTQATFGVYCRRWDIPLMDGGTVRLPRIVGQGHALDMILTGRGVKGDEAYRIGLVDRLVEPESAVTEALSLAATIANLPQTALRSDRASVMEQWSLPVADAIGNEYQHGDKSLRSGAFRQGLSRYDSGRNR